MAERVKLTKSVVDKAVHEGAGNQSFLRDSELAGFCLRITAGRVKSYCVEYTVAGRNRRVTLGGHGRITVDQARTLALNELNAAAMADKGMGVDPAEKRKREKEGDTLQDVATRYLDDLKGRAKAGAAKGRLSGWESAKGLWGRHVPPSLKSRKVADITTADVSKVHKKLGNAGMAPTADHVRTVLHSVLELALAEGLIDRNPATAVKRYSKPSKRRRALTLEELASMGEALSEAERTGKLDGQPVDPAGVLAMRLLALTGMRKSELLGHHTSARRGPREGLRWADMDLDGRSYRLQSHGGGSGGKGGEPRVLPLGQAVVDLLRGVKPEDVDEERPVCPSPRDASQPFQYINPVRGAVYEAAEIEGADLHSLRHSFESIAFSMGPAYGGCLTGRTIVKGSLRAYVHIDADVLHELADKVAGRIGDAMAGRLADVVPIERKRGQR